MFLLRVDSNGHLNKTPIFATLGRTMAEEQKPLKISKIVIDRELCIGAASCVVIAPGTFQMDEENKAYLVDLNGHDAETIKMAAESCPTKAIFLYDNEGKQIYP